MNDLPTGPVRPRPPDTTSESNIVTYVPLEYGSDLGPESFTLSHILGTLRRHPWLIAGVTVLAVGATALVLSREKPLYQASSLVRLTDPSALLDQALESRAGARDQPKAIDPLASEVMVLTGRGVAGEAVDREGLRLFSVSTGAPASFVEDVEIDLPPERFLELELAFQDRSVVARSGSKRAEARYGEPIELNGVRFTVPPRGSGSAELVVVPRERAVDYVSASLIAEAVRGTDGVTVSFTSTDPRVAPRVVNAVVDEYKALNTEGARGTASRQRAFLEKQLRENDSLLMIAQSALSGLRGRTQAYSAASKFGAEQANLMAAQLRTAELAANRHMAQSIVSSIELSRETGSSANLSLLSTPGIGNPVVSQLQTQLMQYQMEREEATTGPWAKAMTHPDVQRYDALIASTEQKLVQALRSQIASLDAQIGAAGSLSGRAAGAISQLPSVEVQEVRLIDQVETLRNLSNQLRSAYQTARMEEAVEGGYVQIVSLASSAPRVATNASVKLLLALVVGLLLGSGIALVRDRLDRTIHRPEDIDDFLQIPSLAVIPRIASAPRNGFLRKLLPGTNGKSDRRSEKVAAPLPNIDSEPYRLLRTKLIFSKATERLKTLVVTSPMSQEGKTMTAVNLAKACAEQGLRVILVDCDLRRPVLAREFDVDAQPDLAAVLQEKDEPWRAVRPSGLEGLDILPTRIPPHNASELLGLPAMRRLLEDLSQRYDMVILDTPPLLIAADAAVLGGMADGVLLVIRAGSTDRRAAQQAMDHLISVGARIVGAVLNDPDSTVRRYGGHYYHSYYEYSKTS